MKKLLQAMRYMPLLKPYEIAFTDTLSPSQRNHLRVLLETPAKLEQLRRALGLPARRKLGRVLTNPERRGTGLPPMNQNGNGHA